MARRGSPGRTDLASLIGVPLGIGLILVGQMLQGGQSRTLFQTAAALIVFGGTLGAVLVSFGGSAVRGAIRSLPKVFRDPLEPSAAAIGRIGAYARHARRAGMLALEPNLDLEPDPFLRRALTMAVDGSSQPQIRHALEVEMETIADRDDQAARVFESAGGYAPTIGILGAVLGLIHVMENLTDPAKLGPGIAVAFVATLYGVGAANLILLPIATKLRQRGEAAMRRRELLLDGVLAIQEGLNPRLIEQRLSGFEAAPAIRNARPSPMVSLSPRSENA